MELATVTYHQNEIISGSKVVFYLQLPPDSFAESILLKTKSSIPFANHLEVQRIFLWETHNYLFSVCSTPTFLRSLRQNKFEPS